MASFKDLLLKLANNARLTPQELDELGRFGTDTQQRNSFVSGNITAQNTLNIKYPFEVFYNEVFSANVTEVTVEVPPDYNNILIMFAGRSTKAGTTYAEVYGRFNGDDGSNYIGNQIQLAVTSLSGLVGVATTAFGVCVLPADGTTAGSSGGSFMYIPNIRSNLWKYCLNLQSSKQIGAAADTSMLSMFQSFWWKDVSAIKTIKIYAVTDAIKAGSNLIFAGIR